MKLSVKSLVIAAALLKALCFLFVSLLNSILPPYGGAFLALLTSLYVGYDPMAGPISVLVGDLILADCRCRCWLTLRLAL